ncbi:MAG: ribosome recycling factor [Bdellovibrionales bacterium]|nr:ribosome recycling factor [Bdellovibrionales bacterium]
MAFETTSEIISYHSEQCDSSVSAFRRELKKVRTGRASTGLLEGITVDYYGSKTPLNALAQISTPEARLILLQVYDSNAIEPIEKAIISSGLGLNPSRDGNVVRISVPALTEETRKDITRHLHKMAEDIRVSIRNHRRDANESLKKLEKEGDLSKDDSKRAQEAVQKQTDQFISKVDELLSAKEAEILEV